jgi:hypothetical protein
MGGLLLVRGIKIPLIISETIVGNHLIRDSEELENGLFLL